MKDLIWRLSQKPTLLVGPNKKWNKNTSTRQELDVQSTLQRPKKCKVIRPMLVASKAICST